MNDFLMLPNVLCVGGSWIVPKDAIQAKDFTKITARSQEAISQINKLFET
jgi:2-dehydro-3-deoxyphosphogluconate aldolase/(4S)-4-hydroxy-2-oxoglutarate aldolase